MGNPVGQRNAGNRVGKILSRCCGLWLIVRHDMPAQQNMRSERIQRIDLSFPGNSKTESGSLNVADFAGLGIRVLNPFQTP